jgi:hypothetical protein
LPNQPEPAKSAVNFTLDYNVSVVQSLDNGGKQLELEFVDDALTASSGGVDVMKLDSTSTDDPDHNPARAPIGAHLEFYTDADGTVQRVEGVDELMQRISATGKTEAPATFKQIFGGDNLKKIVFFDGALPNRTINFGGNWKIKKKIASTVGPLAVDVTCTFKNWGLRDNRKCVHIESEGDFSSKKASPSDGAMMEIKKGKIFGDSWFDPKLGMIVSSSADEMMSMTVGTQTATYSPQVNQKVRITLLGVE